MISFIFSMIGFITGFANIALIIIGVIQCKKHSFMPGFYFFVFMIVGFFYDWISPYFIRKSIENHHMTGMGMTSGGLLTIGERMILFHLIPGIITVIALGFLVLGLYRMWNGRHLIRLGKRGE